MHMDTIIIGFFLGELYGLSCCACDIGIAFLYGKTKEKVYITAGTDFGSRLYGKNLIINEPLYGLKTSAARFYEHLAESLLRLGFRKTKHDPDLWMVDKTSHYEYLATYVDDILIWSKDRKCGIFWRNMEESRVKTSNISKDLYPERHS
jgi:Reverse transcriptase (RNA-dependent DNA polymerase)